MNEIQLMKKINRHGNVVQLLEVFENEKTVFMVLEYAN